jgi:hypothetical protein
LGGLVCWREVQNLFLRRDVQVQFLKDVQPQPQGMNAAASFVARRALAADKMAVFGRAFDQFDFGIDYIEPFGTELNRTIVRHYAAVGTDYGLNVGGIDIETI